MACLTGDTHVPWNTLVYNYTWGYTFQRICLKKHLYSKTIYDWWKLMHLNSCHSNPNKKLIITIPLIHIKARRTKKKYMWWLYKPQRKCDWFSIIYFLYGGLIARLLTSRSSDFNTLWPVSTVYTIKQELWTMEVYLLLELTQIHQCFTYTSATNYPNHVCECYN